MTENTTLLWLGGEEGSSIRLRALPNKRLEIRTAMLEFCKIQNHDLDRETVRLIRDALDRWLGETA